MLGNFAFTLIRALIFRSIFRGVNPQSLHSWRQSAHLYFVLCLSLALLRLTPARLCVTESKACFLGHYYHPDGLLRLAVDSLYSLAFDNRG